MVRIIDTYSQINALFENGTFHIEKWEKYINSIYEHSAHIIKDDLKEYFDSGNYTFEKDFLPVINAVYENPALDSLHDSFTAVTDQLNARILECFGSELNIEIVLYLGLGNAAGWVTNINGKDTVLLGVEKIVELNWQGVDAMRGLIYHELGHVYQKQHGVLKRHSDDKKRNYVWQLFTEGIAMYFEQVLVNDLTYYHQNTNGWRGWCDDNFGQILADFNRDLPTMNRTNQRYFGDWANYCGHGDVGYYLGARFVHYLAGKYGFGQLINLDIDTVYDLYMNFVTEQMNP